MATGFYLPDGRDFSSVFTSGNAGLNTGFKTANGTDIGNQFVAGNSGITTNYISIGGGDLGSKLGIAQYSTQILVNSRQYSRKEWTINKFITSITYNSTNDSGLSEPYLYIDNNQYGSTNGVNKTITINRQVATITYVCRSSGDYQGYITYLAITIRTIK